MRTYRILHYGDHGVGKTFHAFSFPSPTAVIDLELRARDTISDFFSEKKEDFDVFDGKILDSNYQIDGIESLKKINSDISIIIENLDKYKTIVFDNATTLIKIAVQWYLKKYNKKKIYPLVNWRYPNAEVRKITDKLINISQEEKKHLIITSEKTGKYENTGELDEFNKPKQEQVGVKPDLKKFVAHDMSIVMYSRIINVPGMGKRRVCSFDKHAIIGDVDMNLGFIDMTFKKLVRIHKQLQHNHKEYNKKELNRDYKPRVVELEDIFGKESFNLVNLEGMMKKCRICGAMIDDNFEWCPRCGQKQTIE